MKSGIWLGVIGAVAVLSVGGALLWFTASTTPDAAEPNPGSISPGTEVAVPTGTEVFTGEDLAEFLLSRTDIADATGLTLDLTVASDRFVQLNTVYTPDECRFADGLVTRSPAGYRSLDATAAAGAPTPLGLQQAVYQFPTVADAEGAVTGLSEALTSCGSFFIDRRNSSESVASDVSVAPESLPEGTLPAVAWLTTSVSDSPTVTGWVVLRFGNVVTAVHLASPMSYGPNGEAPSGALLADLAGAVQDRALRAGASVGSDAATGESADTAEAGDSRPALTGADLMDADIPAVCEHSAGTLVNGALPGIEEGNGGALLTEEDQKMAFRAEPGAGQIAAAVVVQCHMGGVGWPDTVVFYDRDRAILGRVDLGPLSPSSYRDTARQVWFDGDTVRVEWANERPATGDTPTNAYLASASFHWDGDHVVISDQAAGETPLVF